MTGADVPDGPALALVELCSIARGVLVCDAMVKKSPVRLVHAGSTHPGKYSVLVGGGVDEVREALDAGRHVAAEALVDTMFLAFPHEELVAALEKARQGGASKRCQRGATKLARRRLIGGGGRCGTVG